ncbi:DUF6159 family protein [Nocardia lijiangensis]|uniref:DUF6159 family protein n=1 Tax=Nocardia lijiangensis TaxID=299618 RepID=UPI003D746A7E
MLTTGFRVLTAHRALVAFPAASAATGAVVLGALYLVLRAAVNDPLAVTPFLLFGVSYLLIMIVTTFANAALIAQADLVLRGGYPSTGAGWRAALSRSTGVLPWALAAATVLPVLRLIEHDFRDMRSGRRGTAWADAAHLTLPKIVLERRNPIDALRDSRVALERGWGTDMVASTRLGVVGYTVLIVTGSMVPLVGAMLGAEVEARLGLSGGGAAAGLWLGLAAFITALIFVSAATAVYQASLYRYSVDGRTPPAFAADLTRSFQP